MSRPWRCVRNFVFPQHSPRSRRVVRSPCPFRFFCRHRCRARNGVVTGVWCQRRKSRLLYCWSTGTYVGACRISADESQDQFSGTRGWPSSRTRAWGGGFPAAACSSIRLVQLPVKTLPLVSRSPRMGIGSTRHWSVHPRNMAAGMRMRGHSRARPTTRRQLARFPDRRCATSPRPLDDTLSIPSWCIGSARREAAFGSPDLYECATRSVLASEGWVNNRRLPAIREAWFALNATSGGLPRGKPASARMRPGCSPLRSPLRASECATTFVPSRPPAVGGSTACKTASALGYFGRSATSRKAPKDQCCLRFSEGRDRRGDAARGRG